MFSSKYANYLSLAQALEKKVWFVILLYNYRKHDGLNLKQIETDIEKQPGSDFPHKMLKFFDEEEEEIINEIEESLENPWGKDSSENEESPEPEKVVSKHMNHT